MKTKSKWVIIGSVTAVIIFLVVSSKMTGGVPVQASAAFTGEIRAYVENRAKTSLPRVYRLTMPLDGRILPIALREGTPVTNGQIVARMDTADLDTAVAVAESRLAGVRAEIALNKNNALENTAMTESAGWISAINDVHKASQAKVMASEAQLKYTSWWLDSVKQVEAVGAVAQQQLREAQTDYAKANVDVASDELNSRAIFAIRKIADLLPKYINQYIDRKAMKRDILNERLNGAAATLARARRDRVRAIVRSPSTGVVLKRHVQNERVLSAGAPLLDVGCLTKLEVKADLLSQDAVAVRTGNVVSVYGAAIGATPVAGVVTRVDPEGFTKLSSLGVEQQRVNVTIAFNKNDLDALEKAGRALGVDYRVRVRIFTAEKKNAVIIPRTALFRGHGNTWQTYVARKGKARLVTVKLGLTNDREAEIIDGINAGDTVIVAPPASLKDGTRVKCGATDESV